jgi:hypothetical protein
MKRYLCTVAAGMLLALAASGTATAGLPVVGGEQSGTQTVGFGDQAIGEQRNDADVTQAQGNGNVNVSPAISIFGDASTSNSQGNDNTAVAVVDQSNSATQTQSAEQDQSLTQDGSSGCCQGSTQSGEQKVFGGDQTIDEQRNDADVEQYQGNGNLNVSPAISVFGDASTRNSQGNGNTAVAKVDQSNSATQSQSSSQQQDLSQQGCCEPKGCETQGGCKPHKEYEKKGYERKKDSHGGPSQTGEQKIFFGDQHIGKQKNDADVVQKQGNGNVNVSPAVTSFPHFEKHRTCSKSNEKCGGPWLPEGGAASTWNSQGNGNFAFAGVEQSNAATQSQSAAQNQSLVQGCCEALRS